MTRRVSIIMPVSARGDLTRRAIASIERDTPPGAARLVLAAGPESALEGSEGVGRIVRDEQPFNFARRVNLAIRAAASDDDCILINNDVVVTPGWFEALTADRWALSMARTRPGRCGNSDAWGPGPARPTRGPLNFFCVWLPKWARDIVGELDERFDAYGGEDVDYTLRARRLAVGTSISAAFVEHDKHASFGPAVVDGPLQRGMDQFAIKWGVRLERAFGSFAEPRVSVVIANRNHGRFLRQAVESIAAQDYPFVEIVVVDDGSSDDSASVLDELAEGADPTRLLKILKRQPKGGAAAKNFGVRAATGGVIAFQDADDFSRPGRIRAQLSRLADSASTDFCYTDLVLAGPDGAEIAPFPTGEPDIDSILRMRTCIAGATLMFRKPTWEAVGGFDESADVSRAYDFDLVLRASERDMRFAFVPRKLYVYRRHGANSCGTGEAIRQHVARANRFRLEAARRAS